MAASLFPTTIISSCLPRRHLLCHEPHHSQVTFFHAAEQPAELGKQASVLALAAPQDVVGSFPLREVRQFGRFFAVVEELVHRDFEGASKCFKGLDSRNCVSVLDPRDVAAKQSRSLLDRALRKLLFLTQCTQTLSDNHGLILHTTR